MTKAKAVLTPCYAGRDLDGKSIYNTLEEFQVNNTAGVPTLFLGLLDYMAANKARKLHYLKTAVVGGAACPRKIFDAFGRYSCAKCLPSAHLPNEFLQLLSPEAVLMLTHARY